MRMVRTWAFSSDPRNVNGQSLFHQVEHEHAVSYINMIPWRQSTELKKATTIEKDTISYSFCTQKKTHKINC